jgi:hypothetical protein
MASNMYENWVDKIIHSHKKILENFKNGRSYDEKKEKVFLNGTNTNVKDSSSSEYKNYRNLYTPDKNFRDIDREREKFQKSEEYKKFEKSENKKNCKYCQNCENSPQLNLESPRSRYYNTNSYFSENKKNLPQFDSHSPKSKIDTITEYNPDLNALKNSKIQKLVDCLIEENAELKIRLQESEKQLDLHKSNLSSLEKENYSNSQIFLDRERDLIETINLLDVENQKLKEKLNEMKFEMTKKSKDLERALSINDSVINNRNNLNNSNLSIKKGMVDEEYLFKCLKLDKVIEVINNFFKKFEVDLENNIKAFDYEGIRIKLNEFEEIHVKSKFEKKENFNFNLTTENSDKKAEVHVDPDFLSKLDSRLKELESNVNSVIKKKNEKLTNVSEMSLTQSSNTSNCQLNCNIKNTKISPSSNVKFANVKTEKNLNLSVNANSNTKPKKICNCRAHSKSNRK